MTPRRAQVDGSFVLDWLRQAGAPENLVGLQERVVEGLGGYVGPAERIAAFAGDREGRFDADATIDPDIVRAIAWCRLGGPDSRPRHDRAFHEAEALGLLAHDPIWRATPQGEGVLIALGFLPPTWEPERRKLLVLWAREPREGAPAQFVRAWPESAPDVSHEGYVHEKALAEAEWRLGTGVSSWLFFVTTEEVAAP